MKNSILMISRHEPNADQIRLAAEQNYDIVHVGDMDAFDPNLTEKVRAAVNRIEAETDSEVTAVCAVHPLIAFSALKLGTGIASFRNENRAPIGAKPDFLTTELVVKFL